MAGNPCLLRMLCCVGAVMAGANGEAALDARAAPPSDLEFIRVAPDRWSFEGADSHRRFIPFGSNLVLTSKEDLNLFGPRYATERYESILDACEKLHITLLKVFLPIGQVLPDPQLPGEARIAPGYLDNLENFLGLCRKHHIRAVVTLCSWGGNQCAWWQEGGQYFGRCPWKTELGVDSLGVLCRFWTQVATRFRDNPTVFSYTPAVEWTLPCVNLTWFPPNRRATARPGHSPTVPSEPGLWYWRHWLEAKYTAIDKLNAAWGSEHASFEGIPVANYAYDHAAHAYVAPEQEVFDYSNFREWATLRYLTPQIAAIRAADPKHMVTISNHMRSWDLWEGAAQHFLGATPFEQKHLIDYATFHANFHEKDSNESRTDADIIRTAKVLARFCAAGKAMPIILEEYSFTSAKPERVAEVQSALARGTLGHVSGWTTWYLQYPGAPLRVPETPHVGADSSDPSEQSSWLTADLEATPWGEAARALYERLAASDLGRVPAKTTVTLDRRESLVPKSLTTLCRHYKQYEPSIHPIDYEVTHEPSLDVVLPGDTNCPPRPQPKQE